MPCGRAACLLVLATAAVDARAGVLEDRPLNHYVHDHWTNANGLPQNGILGIAQTTDGYLWLGTNEGLVRFDGAAFRNFDTSTHRWIRRDSIWSVHALRNGTLVFGSSGALGSVRDGATVAPLFQESSVSPIEFSALLEGTDGSLWAGTPGSGLKRWDGARLTQVGDEALARSPIRSLAQTLDGRLWLGTDEGLVSVSNGQRASCRPCDLLPKGSVLALAAPPLGGLLVGGAFGLFRITPQGTVEKIEAVRNVVQSLLETDSVVWVGTTRGLLRLRGGQVESDASLENARVTDLLLDREGSLWAGTDNQGLFRIRSAPAWMLGRVDGFPEGSVSMKRVENAIWVTTRNGEVFRRKDGSATADRVPIPFEPGEYLTAMSSFEGEVWAATTNGRLLVQRRGRFVDSRWGGPRVFVYFLQPSSRGLWVGAGGRIYKVVRGKAVRLIDVPGGNGGSGLREWPDGHLTLATFGGLFEWRDGKLTNLAPRPDGLPRIVAVWRYESDGTLWLGLNGEGLMRFRNGVSSLIGRRQGLPRVDPLGIADDGRGFFWICTGRGIFRISKAEANAVADGRLGSIEPLGFSAEDGLGSAECNGGNPVPLIGGLLHFATSAGVAVLDPARIDLKPSASLLRIAEVRADGEVVAPGARLSPDTQALEFDYASMSFRVPSRVSYTYQLIGYDKAPVDAQNRRIAYYSHLPHGDYRFVVSAVNEDGARNASPVAFDFSVAPRFHERTDARVGFVALGVGGIFAVFRLWTRALRQRQKELERIVFERTKALAIEKERAEAANAAKTRFVSSVSHELRTPLNAILGFTDLLRGASGQRNRDEYLDIVKSSGAHLLTLVNSVLSLTEIEAGEQQSVKAPFAPRLLVREVVRMMTPRAEAKGLRLLEDLDILPDWLLGDAPRIRQILINLIGNAIKFTAKGHVTLHVSREDERTTFAVEDSGPGIAPAEQAALFQEFSQTEAGLRSGEGTGLGLAISRRLATLMKGELTLDGSDENGSTFLLTLDLVEAATPAATRTRRVFGLLKQAALAPALVVDDSELNRRLMRELHQRIGLGVIEASNGPEGLRLFEENTPSMVWTDAQMPGYGGEELARRIRALEDSRGGTRTPMVAVTASALGDEREALRRAGCDDVILKPFEENLFFETLARHLKLELNWLERSADRYPSGDVWVGGAASWDEDFEELRRAVGAAEWEAVRRTAHSLKGEASLRGRDDMAAEFGILEEQALGRCSDLPLRNALENVERLMRASETAGS